jgi:hypothetical protein
MTGRKFDSPYEEKFYTWFFGRDDASIDHQLWVWLKLSAVAGQKPSVWQPKAVQSN